MLFHKVCHLVHIRGTTKVQSQIARRSLRLSLARYTSQTHQPCIGCRLTQHEVVAWTSHLIEYNTLDMDIGIVTRQTL